MDLKEVMLQKQKLLYFYFFPLLIFKFQTGISNEVIFLLVLFLFLFKSIDIASHTKLILNL